MQTVESAPINLEAMFHHMNEDGKEPATDSTSIDMVVRPSGYLQEFNDILEQTNVAIDLCNHRLLEDGQLRSKDFEVDVETNVKVSE